MSSRDQINTILRQVHDWPREDRVALAYEIPSDMRRAPLAPPPRDTAARARGLLRTADPPPSDEDVKRWIDAHRMRKYG